MIAPTLPETAGAERENATMTEERAPKLAGGSEASAGGGREAEAATERPRSPLGRRLREIRERIVASGVPLLNAEELEAEIAKRRGTREELP